MRRLLSAGIHAVAPVLTALAISWAGASPAAAQALNPPWEKSRTNAAPANPARKPRMALPAFLARPGMESVEAPAPMAGYVGSESCRSCHEDEHASWHRSYHRTMTQRMTPEAVLGKFEGVELESGGYRYRLTHEGDRYFSEGPDPDLLMYWVQGKKKAPPADLPRVKLPVVMATGSHHYQTYWVPSPRHPGILQTLPLVFLRETGRWAPREAAFLHGPDDPERFVTQWNHHCITCHSTGGNPGLDRPTGELRTQVVELGISCEACHGPGGAHVAARKAAAPGAKVEPDPIVNPAKLDAARANSVCGQCHGVFMHRDEFAYDFAQHGNLFRPGELVERTRYYPWHPGPGAPAEAAQDVERNPQFYRNRWWPDGQMLAGGREFTALRESACGRAGAMSCLDCHSMHASDPVGQVRRDRPANEACVKCHREDRYNRDLTAHTHHRAGSTGSDCRNCHMPHSSYALFKGVRNHKISVPRVAPVGSGVPPNACNLCHVDRTLSWTQEALRGWYGREPVKLPDGEGEVSAVADTLLRGDAAQRAVAAWHLGWDPAVAVGGGAWMRPVLATALADEYGPVRFIAARSLRRMSGMTSWDFDYLIPLAERRKEAERLIRLPAGGGPEEPGRPERLQRPDGSADEERLRALLLRQDRRSVTVNE